MKPRRISLLVQLGFALLYAVVGFLFLLHPSFGATLQPPVRIGLGVLLLAYSGYRLYSVYQRFSSPFDDD